MQAQVGIFSLPYGPSINPLGKPLPQKRPSPVFETQDMTYEYTEHIQCLSVGQLQKVSECGPPKNVPPQLTSQQELPGIGRE